MFGLDSVWRGKRVLVTGCTGFLGGAVVEELLARDAEVIGLVRNRTSAGHLARHQLSGRVHILHGLVEDLFRIHSALAVHEANAVFHFAASEPITTDRGTATVLEAVRRYDPRVPVIVARPAEAESKIDASIALGIAKFGELFGAVGTLARLPDAKSPRTTGSTIRDYVHVRDAARACLLLAECAAGESGQRIREEHFRSGWLLSERDMAAAIQCVSSNRSLEVAFSEQKKNPLNWSPELNFSEAIADSLAVRGESARLPFLWNRTSEPARRTAA